MGLLLCFFHRNFIIIVGLLLSAADCRRRRVKLNWKRVAVWHRDRLLPVRRLDKIVRLKKPASEPLRLSKQHSSNDINTHTHTQLYYICACDIWHIGRYPGTLRYRYKDTDTEAGSQVAVGFGKWLEPNSTDCLLDLRNRSLDFWVPRKKKGQRQGQGIGSRNVIITIITK